MPSLFSALNGGWGYFCGFGAVSETDSYQLRQASSAFTVQFDFILAGFSVKSKSGTFELSLLSTSYNSEISMFFMRAAKLSWTSAGALSFAVKGRDTFFHSVPTLILYKKYFFSYVKKSGLRDCNPLF